MVAVAFIHKVALLSVCEAKAMALLEGLKLARATGVKLVDCYSYTISVVNQVNMLSWPFVEEDNLIVEIEKEFQNLELSFIQFFFS